MTNRLLIIGDEVGTCELASGFLEAITRANHSPLVPRGGLGLLSLGVMVWFVVLGVEEGLGKPTVFTVVLAKKLISVTN